MSRSANSIAESIIEKMHKQNLDCATIPWNRFYVISKRERITEKFMLSLKLALKKKSFLLSEGSSVVTVSKDFNFLELSIT
jgi:hypothetical protein